MNAPPWALMIHVIQVLQYALWILLSSIDTSYITTLDSMFIFKVPLLVEHQQSKERFEPVEVRGRKKASARDEPKQNCYRLMFFKIFIPPVSCNQAFNSFARESKLIHETNVQNSQQLMSNPIQINSRLRTGLIVLIEMRQVVTSAHNYLCKFSRIGNEYRTGTTKAIQKVLESSSERVFVSILDPASQIVVKISSESFGDCGFQGILYGFIFNLIDEMSTEDAPVV